MIRALALLWSLGPLLWQLLTSLRPPDALVGAGSALPGAAAMGGWTLANYRLLLMADPPFWRYLLNSTVVGLAASWFWIRQTQSRQSNRRLRGRKNPETGRLNGT